MIRERFIRYYELTKPGIIYGNGIVAVAGFFLASKGHFQIWLFLSMILGLSLVIASGCVFNNYLDRDIDPLMERTKKRALVTGTISPQNALIYATILGVLGSFLLFRFTNVLTAEVALFGLFFYVIPYGLAKRRTVYGTLVGSISGAVPPVVGYCAVTGRLDTGALLLFLVLVVWQMPHFYAIAMYRLSDYQAAKIPVLPAVSGILTTRRQIMAYVTGFIILSASLFVFHYTGYIYAVCMLALGIAWLRMGTRAFTPLDPVPWARQMFRFSLIVLLSFSFLISIQNFLI